MVKKRRVRKVKRSISKIKRPNPVRSSRVSGRKFKIVTTNLILFIILGVISYALYSASEQLVYVNLFLLLSFLFGFVSLAFFIALLVLLILRGMRK